MKSPVPIRLLGTTWKSPISLLYVKNGASLWGFHCTCRCYHINLGRLDVKIWKPKFLRCGS
jgi:hypothetical protein